MVLLKKEECTVDGESRSKFISLKITEKFR